MVEQKSSLLEAYLKGARDLVVWLFPAVVVGLVITLSHRAFLPPPPANGGN